MDVEQILTRAEVKECDTWNTADIFASDEDFLKALDECKERIDGFSRFRELGFDSADNLLAFYTEYDSLLPVFNNVFNYASLRSDVDTTDPVYQDYRSRVMSAAAALSSATSFSTPKLLKLSDEELEAFYREKPELLRFRRAIDDERRLSAHTLSEDEEYLVSLAGELVNTPEDTFSMLTYADLKFDPIVYQDKKYELTASSYSRYMESTDRELRKLAFETLYKRFDELSNTYAAILSSQMKALSFKARAKKYSSTLDAALDMSNVSTDVYRNLIKTVHDNLHYMHEYVALRKKLLGVSELHMYDVYAPLVADSDTVITFEEARDNVLEAMQIYGEDYMNILRKGFDSRWIDKYENKGKRGGAYSCGCPVHPYVLLNHKNNIDSEFTLAHEMGHAMHSYLSNSAQAPIDAEYTLFVAEVASTCNESLLMQHLLKKTTDRKDRAVLINHFLEQFKGTLFRQTMFAEFELMINEMYERGEALTADVLREKYIALNREYFGDEMISDPQIALEWARIPHFYYNYYVYQYATGFSAAIALSGRMLKEGEPAVKDYLRFLSSGCTKDPVSLLREAGVDMATPKPIEDALKLFGELICEMKELTD